MSAANVEILVSDMCSTRSGVEFNFPSPFHLPSTLNIHNIFHLLCFSLPCIPCLLNIAHHRVLKVIKFLGFYKWLRLFKKKEFYKCFNSLWFSFSLFNFDVFSSPSSKFQLDMFLLFDCLEIKDEVLMKYVRVLKDFLCLHCTSFFILVPKDLRGFLWSLFFLIIHFVAFFFHFQLDIFYSVLLYGNGMWDFNGVNVKVYEVSSCLFLVYFVFFFKEFMWFSLCLSLFLNLFFFFQLDVFFLFGCTQVECEVLGFKGQQIWLEFNCPLVI